MVTKRLLQSVSLGALISLTYGSSVSAQIIVGNGTSSKTQMLLSQSGTHPLSSVERKQSAGLPGNDAAERSDFGVGQTASDSGFGPIPGTVTGVNMASASGSSQLGGSNAVSEKIRTNLVATSRANNTDAFNTDSTHADATNTDDLQDKVLMRINEGLVNNSLSISTASKMKTELNNLNQQETIYRTQRLGIPQAVIEKNTLAMDEMLAELEVKPVQTMPSSEPLHTDVEDLISKALASKRITSSQAEKYYVRLAQIESAAETAKFSSGANSASRRALNEIRAELTR